MLYQMLKLTCVSVLKRIKTLKVNLFNGEHAAQQNNIKIGTQCTDTKQPAPTGIDFKTSDFEIYKMLDSFS